MADITLFHNPRCSKSRQALALLQERGIEPAVVEYLKTPPTAAQLDRLLKQLKLEPRELMRRDEDEYRELELDNPVLSRAQLIDAMAEHPRLIQRPILIKDDKAVIGRPPEKILDLF